MITAVFISDLHLHPQDEVITKRFYAFIHWAAHHTKSVYILGDFFHVWAGDDTMDDWSQSIAARLAWLHRMNVSVYLMHGNRDFLIGSDFAKLAKIQIISEPLVLELGSQRVLLSHGDRYCTNDVSHQWLRRLTRNRMFPSLFLRIPRSLRCQLVNTVRSRSRRKNYQSNKSRFDVVSTAMLKHMSRCNANALIHGHTHNPGLLLHEYQGKIYRQFVLSDWDDTPWIMCYHKSNGLYFELLN